MKKIMRETGFEPVSPETAVLKTAGITELTDSRYNFINILSFFRCFSNHILKNNKNSKNNGKNSLSEQKCFLLFSYLIIFALFFSEKA